MWGVEERNYLVTMQFSFVGSTIIRVGAEWIFVFPGQAWITAAIMCFPKYVPWDSDFPKCSTKRGSSLFSKNVHEALCRQFTICCFPWETHTVFITYWGWWDTLEVNLLFLKLLTNIIHFNVGVQWQWIF